MLFHMERIGSSISGWLTPDNPSEVPRVQIIRPDGTSIDLNANFFRPDLVELKMHPTGNVGFQINNRIIPDFDEWIDKVEIRDAITGVTVYRAYNPAFHVSERVFRFELRAMPYASVEAAWNKAFALYYNAVERHPFETFFGIMNNPAAQSLALSGRPSLHRYEQFFRDRHYKFVTVLRDPFEELAERLLFLRYALAHESRISLRDHLTNLMDLRVITQRLDLSNFDSFYEAFSYLTDRQIEELSNPLVKALACNTEDPLPRAHHIQVALNKLSTFDLVGTYPNFAEFKSSLIELLGRDILGNETLVNIEPLSGIVAELKNIKRAKQLVAHDIQLYEFASKAVKRAVDSTNDYHYSEKAHAQSA